MNHYQTNDFVLRNNSIRDYLYCLWHGRMYVMITNHGGEHTIYPDCRIEFITEISKVMAVGTFEEIAVLAPYTTISKNERVFMASTLGYIMKKYGATIKVD